MKKSAIIVAGGSGARLGFSIPKAFVKLAGWAMFEHSVVLFENLGFDQIILAVPENFIPQAKAILADRNSKTVVVSGGRTRTDSVRSAFNALDSTIEIIGIHDAARPLLTPEDAIAVFEAAQKHGSATLAIPVVDTLKSVNNGIIESTLPREGLWAVQTPQVFLRDIIRRALELEGDFTDDCAMAEVIGEKVRVIKTSKTNLKITYPEDLVLAEAILSSRIGAL